MQLSTLLITLRLPPFFSPLGGTAGPEEPAAAGRMLLKAQHCARVLNYFPSSALSSRRGNQFSFWSTVAGPAVGGVAGLSGHHYACFCLVFSHFVLSLPGADRSGFATDFEVIAMTTTTAEVSTCDQVARPVKRVTA